MNWLYPNFLRKIDHYLKINHPHIWRTRVHDFGWFSLILGNVLAICLGVLIVGRDNILSEGSIFTMHTGLAVMLGFVGLFWAIHLLRFKIKFSDLNSMFTTWLIYTLCVVSLGLNLATFTSTIAYRTASVYSDKQVQADYDYINRDTKSTSVYYYDGEDYHKGDYYEEPYKGESLKKEYYTEQLTSIMSRYGYQHNTSNEIYKYEINSVKSNVNILKEAKLFVQQPVLGNYFYSAGPGAGRSKRSIYHGLLQIHWIMGGLLLLFLPTLLFLVSVFGVRNVLISVFSTAIIAGGVVVMINLITPYHYSQQERITTTYIFVVLVLATVLIAGRSNLKNWNYIAGVFMLMLGVVFFAFFYTNTRIYSDLSLNPLLRILKILPVSLLVSLTVAWAVARRNDMPVLR